MLFFSPLLPTDWQPTCDKGLSGLSLITRVCVMREIKLVWRFKRALRPAETTAAGQSVNRLAAASATAVNRHRRKPITSFSSVGRQHRVVGSEAAEDQREREKSQTENLIFFPFGAER